MLDTPEAVKGFLSQHYPSASAHIASVVPLSGGFVNHVFRAEFTQPVSLGMYAEKYKSVIVKYGPPYFAGMGPSVPFAQERLRFEVQALTTIPKDYPQIFTDPKLHVPKIVQYFSEQNVILMQDLGPLESLLTSPQHLTGECAQVLAGFISRLHEHTKNGKDMPQYRNDASTKSVFDFVYVPIADVLKENGVENWEELHKLGMDVGKELYNLNGSGPVSVLMGDFWPASILVEPRDGPMTKLWVIDWEFTNLGNPILDVSYLLTVLWAMAVHIDKYSEQIKKYIVLFVDNYKYMDLRACIKSDLLFSVHFAVNGGS
eukprot:Phypoly_transcript_09672.p1 GENE.Phypoly_transcript_09672~~Phypoly_transcript_09672.p1  ORF type:complete len:316 (+),score=32.97 Phypoly_transcript_09672:36-983(+)